MFLLQETLVSSLFAIIQIMRGVLWKCEAILFHSEEARDELVMLWYIKSIWGAFSDLIPFVKFKQRENTHGGVLFVGMLFIFCFKHISCHLSFSIISEKIRKLLIFWCFQREEKETSGMNPVGCYMFKVNYRNTRTRCEVCLS